MRYTIRKATEKDSAKLRALANRCFPLDVHTPYTYWVLCTQSESNFILMDHDKEIGFITSIQSKDHVFIWQIAILEEYRSLGLSKMLIHSVFAYGVERGISEFVVTIAPENQRSFNAFYSYCQKEGYSFEKKGQMSIYDYIDIDFHETEQIYTCRKV